MRNGNEQAAATGSTILDPHRNLNLVSVGLVGPLKPGQEVTDAIGKRWRPKLDRAGKVIIRPTRSGDHFLAQSRWVRIVGCHGQHFAGLTRQIMEPVTAEVAE